MGFEWNTVFAVLVELGAVLARVGMYLSCFDTFQYQLSKYTGVAVKENVPEVVHLTGPRRDVCKFNVIHKPHLHAFEQYRRRRR